MEDKYVQHEGWTTQRQQHRGEESLIRTIKTPRTIRTTRTIKTTRTTRTIRTTRTTKTTRTTRTIRMMTMHCGYLFYLFLALWVELAAGGVLPTNAADSDMQSIIEDLQVALKNYSSILSEASNLGDVPVLSCTETVAQLKQSCEVVRQLSRYQVCAQQSFCPDDSALCRVTDLNSDLLLHLEGSSQDSAGCPTSPPTPVSASDPSHFNSIRESIRCVDCWSRQVEALHK